MKLLTLTLVPDGELAMYEQLYRYFVGEIHAGRLVQGEKLPSKRALCAHLGVSRSTVETAYGLLTAEGYVHARDRSGYYVADFQPAPGVAEAPPRPVAPPPAPAAPPRFDFSTASVDTSRFPYASWAKLNREVVYASPELLQQGDRQGDLELRRALAEFLREYRGVACAPEQIVVGAGMEYLAGLLIQLLPGDSVFALEDPGYASIRNTLANIGRAVRYIPLDERGMQMEPLEASGASVAYVTPSHQFPMGITMPAGRRSQLLRWAERAPERYVIEDDYDSEFRYNSRPLPALQRMDSRGRVVYIGTFSRSIAPSIRIAYMVLPPALLERYRVSQAHSLSTVSRYEQAVMARFISEGFYARYLRRVWNLYRERARALVSALSGIEGARVDGAGGGMHFLLSLPRFSEAELLARADRAGIALRGLSAYCVRAAAPSSTLVVGFGGLKDAAIAQAVRLLEAAWS